MNVRDEAHYIELRSRRETLDRSYRAVIRLIRHLDTAGQAPPLALLAAVKNELAELFEIEEALGRFERQREKSLRFAERYGTSPAEIARQALGRTSWEVTPEEAHEMFERYFTQAQEAAQLAETVRFDPGPAWWPMRPLRALSEGVSLPGAFPPYQRRVRFVQTTHDEALAVPEPAPEAASPYVRARTQRLIQAIRESFQNAFQRPPTAEEASQAVSARIERYWEALRARGEADDEPPEFNYR